MKAIANMSIGIKNLIKNNYISKKEIDIILSRFCKNDWGELNSDDTEEQNRMLIEGFYLKNRNPKLDEIFTGVYIINNIFIWIKSKFDTEKDILSIIVKLPYE
ncbi:hypothetical protein [Clostridium perfringens]|uniref:Uncharacterized protein n=5 Tax=Clostridium perfringens TaxID=1502 RepID=B1BP94_CLOPF|nr:hypothetical protein [Clostridium perfringens]AQW25405.1 hypothetical protein BXT94_00815 [Clostridium perfringens]ATD48993.1 hypothetical protein CMR01_09440 [Clostridium perfringens]EDT16517.1 conserved hypothetical protein [Clostridium perfringens E str. JGS1987]EHK2426074.1 hypothetical protein [Clostridium perfringens]EIA17789.1 hypothetical protein HA1_05642 [Clostridium perfringens F262]